MNFNGVKLNIDINLSLNELPRFTYSYVNNYYDIVLSYFSALEKADNDFFLKPTFWGPPAFWGPDTVVGNWQDGSFRIGRCQT